MATYDALTSSRHIRLLRFRPSSRPNNVQCEMQEFNLSEVTVTSTPERPTFFAISYTWGEPGSETKIAINQKSFSVRPNCRYALSQVRGYLDSRKQSDSWFWVDAICINQEDLVEKGQQVAMMGDIYASARLVLSCVGPADEQCSAWCWQFPERPHIVSPSALEVAENDRLWQINYRLARLPYWTRRWIVQELLLAKKIVVLWGTGSIEFENCSSVDRIMQFSLERRVIEREGSLQLTRAIPSLTRQQCSHSLDYVYALLNIVKYEDQALAIMPDYTKTTLQLAKEVVKLLYETEAKTATADSRDEDLDRTLDFLLQGLGVTHAEEQMQILLQTRHARSIEFITNAVDSTNTVKWSQVQATLIGTRYLEQSTDHPGVKHVTGGQKKDASVFFPSDTQPGDYLVRPVRDRWYILRPTNDKAVFAIIGAMLSYRIGTDFLWQQRLPWECDTCRVQHNASSGCFAVHLILDEEDLLVTQIHHSAWRHFMSHGSGAMNLSPEIVRPWLEGPFSRFPLSSYAHKHSPIRNCA